MVAERTAELVGSAVFVRALGLCSLGIAACAPAVRALVGDAGYLAALIVLVLLTAASALARPAWLRSLTLIPVSLIAFAGIAAVSVLWSVSQWATVAGVLHLGAYAVLATWLALNRDVIQLVRIVADVGRFVLGVGLALEVLVGVLLDGRFAVLGIEGEIAEGGPIVGIAGDTVRLGIIAVTAGIAFATELLSRSKPVGVGIASLVLAAVTIVLSGSAIVIVLAILVVVAGAVLAGLRRLSPRLRPGATVTVLAAVVALATSVWLLRGLLFGGSAPSGELADRLLLWRRVFWYPPESGPVLGWGFLGPWRTDLPPYLGIPASGSAVGQSAANAYLDVWFQLGFIGLVAFLVLVVLAFARSWLLATRQTSVAALWSALTLTALLLVGLVSSALIADYGWMLLVLCAVSAGRRLSWRTAFEPQPVPAV